MSFPLMPVGNYPSAGFSVALLSSGIASAGGSVTVPRVDSRCTLIIVQVRQAGGTSLRPGAAATVDGIAGTVIASDYSTAFDDGHAITATAYRATAGFAHTLAFPSADGWFYAFVMYGVTSVPAAVTDTSVVHNTDGGDHGLATNTVVATTSSTNSVVLFMGMRNGNAAVGSDVTGKLNVFSVAQSALVGFDTNPSSGTTSYVFNTSSPALMMTVTINKNAG